MLQGDYFILRQREHAVLSMFARHGFNPMVKYRILEVGCGGGGVLKACLTWGANPSNLHGIDLVPGRLVRARGALPLSSFICCDGQNLPYRSESFDLVFQFTAFSSVLDSNIRRNMASEMMRVLSPDGMIVWYDFWLNPINPQTRGCRQTEIRDLFPNCQFDFRRITLAPPITRIVARYSYMVCYLLESLRFLNTHYLVAIKPLARNL